MKPPIRVAMIECDTPHPKIQEKYGTYGDMFTALLRAGADSLAQPEVINGKEGIDTRNFNVVNDPDRYPDLGVIDAVLVTGSRFNSFDYDPWIIRLVSFVQRILTQQTHVRVIGACFGHQIVGRALGGAVGRNERGWETSVSKVDLSPKGKELFGKPQEDDTLHIHQMHRDVLSALPQPIRRVSQTPTTAQKPHTIPPNAQQLDPTSPTSNTHLSPSPSRPPVGPSLHSQIQHLGTSPLCTMQGLYIPQRLITVQGHPEFNEEIMKVLLETRKEAGVFGEEYFKEAYERAGRPHDGLAVARGFVKFLLEDEG